MEAKPPWTEIARRLYLAPKTVEANIHRVLQKLEISTFPNTLRRVRHSDNTTHSAVT